MKKILRLTLILVFVLVTINQIWANLIFQENTATIIKVALILAIFELILKPIVKVLLLPINLLTLGTFRIIINTLGLYLAVFLIDDFKVSNISTIPQSWFGIINIPELNFKGIMAFIISSFTISLLLNIYNGILSKKPIKK